jgi:DNA primase
LLLETPALALKHAEMLAALPFSDRSLDRLRHELLNLAASGSRLEKRGLEDHLVRAGLAEIVERYSARDGGFGRLDGPEREDTHAEDIEARFLGAAAQLRDMAERDPERALAVKRFKTEATEENWNAARRLLERQVRE